MNTLRQLAARIARQCAVAAACAFDAVCGMQRCCPLPPRKFEIKFALRRIGILAGFAVCILTFAAPDAQAQTSCDAGERVVTDTQGNSDCYPNAIANISDNCTAQGWDINVFPDVLMLCIIPVAYYTATGSSSSVGCVLFPLTGYAGFPLCTFMFGDPPQFPNGAGDNGRDFWANCSQNGEISGAIPATINIIGAKECTCGAPGYAGEYPDCIACEDGEGVLADGTCGVCPDLIENGICVACPLVGQVVNNSGTCVCPNNHTPFGGACFPDSGDDFGELSDAVLCEAFGGEVLQESLPQEAHNLLNDVNGAGEGAAQTIYRAMGSAIQAKFSGNIEAVNTFLSRYDTGGTDYNADAYNGIAIFANARYGQNTFNRFADDALADILSRVPVRGPDKCVGANNSDAFCILDDEADSAGVLSCQEQFPPLWACRNAGWSFSINNGGSCGVLLTLAGGTTSDQCHLSGSASPQCADVFASTVHYFPSPTLSTDGATLRFVYNCDPNGNKRLIPATTNTIAATECTCPAGEAVQNGVCAVCPSNQIPKNGVCADICPTGQGILADGSCGRCAAHHGVQNGACVRCSPGQGTLPNGTCGSCGVAGYALQNGVCVTCSEGQGIKGISPRCVSCDAGQVVQNNRCVSCGAGEIVQDGACVACPSGSIVSDGACVACTGGRIPVNNACACPTGAILFGGVCTCPDGQGLLDNGSCGTCPPGKEVIDNVCAAPTVLMDLCEGAGWGFSVSENSCGILLTLSGGAASDKCYLSGSTSPKCADVFASTVHYFPSPTLAADGATLRFVYNCDPDGESGLIPATANTIAATECGCESGASFFSDVCISDDGDLGLSDELLCGAFGGTVRTATGGREVCSGMDANDTFCIMDSAVGFPCRGLFKHLRSCNLEFNRKALNPFFCGENCGVQKAVGSECR